MHDSHLAAVQPAFAGKDGVEEKAEIYVETGYDTYPVEECR